MRDGPSSLTFTELAHQLKPQDAVAPGYEMHPARRPSTRRSRPPPPRPGSSATTTTTWISFRCRRAAGTPPTACWR
jgi:hypothetical protein